MSRIKALALDIDGVLTDGGFWWGPNGEEWKRFCFADIMGLSLARKGGLIIAFVSGENSPLVDRLATKMGITDVHKGCKDKAQALRDVARHHQLQMSEICFMGDDINDLPALALAGLSACPADAQPSVRASCQVVTSRAGGYGAVREMVDRLLLSAASATEQER